MQAQGDAFSSLLSIGSAAPGAQLLQVPATMIDGVNVFVDFAQQDWTEFAPRLVNVLSPLPAAIIINGKILRGFFNGKFHEITELARSRISDIRISTVANDWTTKGAHVHYGA